MSGHSAIMESLREVGYRLTPQRTLIVSIIHESKGHITAEKIHSRVVRQYPYVDISTVYRTLQLLKKLHLVSETDLGGGRIQYELSGGARHHHLVCHHCDSTEALDDEVIEPLRARLAKKHGFQADMEHFAIFGLCETCHAKQGEEARP
ncbi:MAG: Fur family transcriptional regulator [Dehalococcoidia bacterium]